MNRVHVYLASLLFVVFLALTASAQQLQPQRKLVDVSTLKPAGAYKVARLTALLPPARILNRNPGSTLNSESSVEERYPGCGIAPVAIAAIPEFTWENNIRFFVTTTATLFGETDMLVREVTPSGETKSSEVFGLGTDFPENVTFDFRKIDFGWPYRQGDALFEVWIFQGENALYAYTSIPVRTNIDQTVPLITEVAERNRKILINGRFVGRRTSDLALTYGFVHINTNDLDITPLSMGFRNALVNFLPEQGYPVVVCERGRCDTWLGRHVEISNPRGVPALPTVTTKRADDPISVIRKQDQ